MSEQDEIERLEGELEEAKAELGRQDNLLVELQDKVDGLTAHFTPNVGEPPFRAAVRDLLDLDWSARDERIFEELRRLKDVDYRMSTLEK